MENEENLTQATSRDALEQPAKPAQSAVFRHPRSYVRDLGKLANNFPLFSFFPRAGRWRANYVASLQAMHCVRQRCDFLGPQTEAG